MVVDEKHIFNLMDTNGRRGDVLNALRIYLQILEELKSELPTETWDKYPTSTMQFLFYERALKHSRDVFKKHDKYDLFIENLGDQYRLFLNKDTDWINNNLPHIADSLDKNIEKRARHYTSNLVKIGFASSNRVITRTGRSYLKGSAIRDSIEELLPLDNINIILLRQLLKLKVFSKPDENGVMRFYAPFYMALQLLLSYEQIDRSSFEVIVQGLGPYSSEKLKTAVRDKADIKYLESAIQDISVDLPKELATEKNIDFNVFKKHFKSSKNSESTSKRFFRFYNTLSRFRKTQNKKNYSDLIDCLEKDDSLLKKAFGYGRAVFDIGSRSKRYDLAVFIEKNAAHELLTPGDFMSAFYSAFSRSKWIDGIKEYSDTTIRLLSATGLFKFKNLPELAYKEVMSEIFDGETLKAGIFGEMTNADYERYEGSKNCVFEKNISLTEILGYSKDKTNGIISNVKAHLNVRNIADVKDIMRSNKSSDFSAHISEKYPKEKIMELIPLFSERKNDIRIKKAVNDAATIPTIYEYIIGIAWYYISNKSFDLYDSLNLTLNADFEPVIHAGGGNGDIVVSYADKVILLEVTLMNKQAQKRGEWEPVLRHSLNLKADNENKETFTFFIADELDYNTINIWRAVAAAALESTNTHKEVDGVVIMPFTNSAILGFLRNNTPHTTIIDEVKKSFLKVPRISGTSWHDEIMDNISRISG